MASPNRTMLELKQTWGMCLQLTHRAPNRTMLELKLMLLYDGKNNRAAPNRTMLELKLSQCNILQLLALFSQLHHAGIETVEVCFITSPHDTPNRTMLELKH